LSKLEILLNECLDRRLAAEITGFHVKTVVQMGWAGLTNGKLLTNAQAHFDVFITSDKNLSFQTNLTRYKIAVIILCPARNQIEDLRPLVPALLQVLSSPLRNKPVFIH
jgi:hypothetical protein